MRTLRLLFIFVILPRLAVAQSQSRVIDSLRQVVTEAALDSAKALGYIELARNLQEHSIDSALATFQRSTKFFDTTETTAVRTKYYYHLAELYLITGDHEKAWHSLERSLIKEVTDSSDISLAHIYDKQGDVKIRMGKYQEATELLMRALPIFESSLDIAGLAGCYNSLGTVMERSERLDQAIIYYQKAYELALEAGELRPAYGYLSNVAIAHAMRKDLERAIPIFKKVIRFAEVQKEIRMEALASGNLGVAYVDLEELDSAQNVISRSLELFSALGHKRGVAAASSQLSKIYLKQGKNQEVIALLQPQVSFVEGNNFVKFEENISRNLAAAYKAEGDYENALLYTEKYAMVRDTTLSRQMSQAVNDAQTKYETEKKESEIERLALEDQLNQTRISRQRLALGGSALGLCLLSLLLFRIYGQKQQIESQSQIIKKSLQEKEVLLREIHHRVKNNLQVISSLLGIQSRKLTDKSAIDALKQSRARVQSMSLIHQNLYQRDNLAGVRLSDYFNKLCANLIHTYQIGADIEIQAEIDDIMLDVDSIIPIGLILNELLTNALKYAFPKQKGNIHVSLKKVNQQICLSVSDDGVGIDEPEKVMQGAGYGYELITALVDKLEGTLNLTSEAGTHAEIYISNYRELAA